MLRLASDFDVHGAIVRGLGHREPSLDLIRTQDSMPNTTSDPDVLAWAAAEGRVLVTNDRNTLVGFAWQRVMDGQHMPGIIVTTNEQSIGSSIGDVLLIAECMSEGEIQNRVIFLPL
ncbi:MAG TPA: DUF5615 family PIN-like protein [Gemmataceae bacterium]|jgi:predicted nuclease of predicted toxin-antitoxin system|nr:DUF5615 family PIN-like protein [Gemmataceae bacterium]